jgi:exonuclease VII large subunit
MAKTNDVQEQKLDNGIPRAASPEAAVAQATPSYRRMTDELRHARWEHVRAVQQAWANATKDTAKANTEFSTAYHQITFDTEYQYAAAYRVWLEAIQGASSVVDANLRMREVHNTYQQAAETVLKKQQTEWERVQQAHQQALAAVAETYAKTTDDALKNYLLQIKTAWNEANINEVDVASLAALAEASGYAVQVAHALRWDKL